MPVSINNASKAGLQNQIEKANETYAPAGIKFVLDDRGANVLLDPATWDTNNCSGGNSAVLSDWARAYMVNTNDVIVFVKGIGEVGCSSPTSPYIMMPTESLVKSTRRSRDGSVVPNMPNFKFFLHEAGHYLSLPHDFKSFNSALDNPYSYDGDISPGGSWSPIFDTPPIPTVSGSKIPWSLVSNYCDDTAWGSNLLKIDAPSGTYFLNPERHGVMSTGINCDLVYRLTSDQITAVRKHVWVTRKLAAGQ